MKKILSLILSTVFCVSLCSCSSENDSKDNEKVFENFRNYTMENALEEDYYIQILRTAAESHVLTEASKMGDDCAFMQYDVTGALKFYRDEKYTTLSAAGYFIPEEKDANWEDFEYEEMSQKYREVFNKLCNMASEKTDSENPLVKSVDKKDNDSKEFPYQYTVNFDPVVSDATSLFKNGGNFSSLSIKFLTDESKKNYSAVSLNCQYDYNGEIYVISVKYGKPDSPDKDGKNGQRPKDIEKIFSEYVEQATAAYQTSDGISQDMLDSYMNQQ